MQQTMSENRALYLAWIRHHFPELYQKSIDLTRATPGLGDLFEDILAQPQPDYSYIPTVNVETAPEAGGFFDSFVTGVSNLASTYVTTQAQIDLVRMNSDRAARGQVPLTYVNGQLMAATTSGYPPSAFEKTLSTVSPLNWLMIGALALGGLFLVTRHR